MNKLILLRSPSAKCNKHSVFECRERVKGWPNIEIYGYRLVWLRVTAIVVNYVTYFSTTSVNHPVMTIKWQLVAQPATDSCSW